MLLTSCRFDALCLARRHAHALGLVEDVRWRAAKHEPGVAVVATEVGVAVVRVGEEPIRRTLQR